VDKNIETYLRELRDAMSSAGADSALVQDALFDAEEHLQAEMAAGSQFATVAQAYGSPDEVAAAYLGAVPVRDMAAAIAAPYPSVTVGAAAVAAAPLAAAPVEPAEPVIAAAPGETFVASEAGAGWIEVGAPADAHAAEAEASAAPTGGAPVEADTLFCPRCGGVVVVGTVYCRLCGAPLPTAEQLAAAAATGAARAAGGAGDTAVRPPREAFAPPAAGRSPFGEQPPYGSQSYGAPYGQPPQGRYPVGVQSGMAAAEAGRVQSERSIWGDIFGPFIDPRTWTSLVYMLFSLGLGIVYFTVVVTGFSTAAGMLILIVGIPLLVLVLGLVRALSFFEGRVVEALLGVRMPRRLRPLPPTIGGSWWRWLLDRIEFWLSDGRTWLSMLYMVLMLPLGIVYFTVSVTLLATSLGLITSPIWGWFGHGEFVMNGTVYTGDFPQFLIPLAFILGVLLLIGTMHAIRWIGRGHAAFAKAMLVRLK
jgi:hypothetical protein